MHAPHHLAKVKPPACAGCLFGAMTKVPWKGQETSSDHQVFVAKKAGQCVSVDQLILTQVGFITQLKGTLTKKRYTTATIFVNHYSMLMYIHLIIKLTSEEKMEAKRVFKHFTKHHVIHILHNHCNNGQFVDNAFKNSSAVPRDNILPFVGLTPTSRTASWKKPSRTSARVQGSSSSMRANNGQPPPTWPFGHTPSVTPSTSISPYLSWSWKTEPQG
jgi:hypothetical protein